jgi:predicted DNA-binding protein YlxM (UPF0122 family)
MDQFEKDECKIIINDYLKSGEDNKKLNVKNTKQLYYIVDFLLEYISNKERSFKEKIHDLTNQNINDYEDKLKSLIQVIEKNNLTHLFKDVLGEKNMSTINQSLNMSSSLYVKNKPINSRPGSGMK